MAATILLAHHDVAWRDGPHHHNVSHHNRRLSQVAKQLNLLPPNLTLQNVMTTVWRPLRMEDTRRKVHNTLAKAINNPTRQGYHPPHGILQLCPSTYESVKHFVSCVLNRVDWF